MDALKKLFTKIKLFFGIGTLSLQLRANPSFSGNDTQLKGSLIIKGKSDQKVTHIKVEFIQEYSKKNSSGELKTTTMTLGEFDSKEAFEIKEGEEKEIHFEIPFQVMKSQNEQMKEKGGVVGAIAGLGALAAGEQSSYLLKAMADVEAATFDPVARLELTRVD